MSYSISDIIVCEATQKVVALNWSYENADGKLSNQWRLEDPYGDVPLASCTDSVLVDFLLKQLPNTSADFDEQIAAAKKQAEFECSLKGYTPSPDGPPVPMPVPDDQIPSVDPV